MLDTFPLADVIVNTSDLRAMRDALVRFVELIFANPFHTPTKDEQAVVWIGNAPYLLANDMRTPNSHESA